jgi:hypothetical protein
MAVRVAFNPEDRFVVGLGNRIVVTTRNGGVFGHDVSNHRVGEAFQFSGGKAAFNLQDRFVVTMGNTLIVTTQNGDVFGHDVSGRDIGPAFQFSGAKAAFNPQDRFVVTMGNKLIVTTQNGDVFGHEISGRNIGPAFKFSGSKAAFNATDRFVVTIGSMLLVTTPGGDVFGHDVSGHDISAPFKLTGSRMAFNPQDRFVTTVGNMMIVTTNPGDAFGAELTGRDFGPIFQLNPNDVRAFDAIDPDNGTTQLATDLPLGGSAHLVVNNTGAFTFTVHAHDSGFDNIDYSLAAVLMTKSGLAFTFGHQGGVEGTSAGLPFGTPRRDDNATMTGANPALKDEFDRLDGATFVGKLAGTDALVEGIKGLISDAVNAAAKELGAAAAKAVIALVV